ncbi:hypothetical protein JHK87_039804 [Glycine soja]|nr:hypothetical protein JHK87_039804 [Glycine soja]
MAIGEIMAGASGGDYGASGLNQSLVVVFTDTLHMLTAGAGAGATKNFEPWRAKDEETDKMNKKKEAEEIGDAMKSLENRNPGF